MKRAACLPALISVRGILRDVSTQQAERRSRVQTRSASKRPKGARNPQVKETLIPNKSIN